MVDYLMHHGVKGQHWGERNGPPYPLKASYKDPKSMSDDMKTWKYKEYTKLQSVEKTERNRSGSCHDQVIFEAEQLRRMGIKPKCTWVMEVSDDGQVGMTHSYVHYKRDGKEHWFENAWSDRAGIHVFNNANDIRKEFENSYNNGTWGNKKKYPNLDFTDFDPNAHEPGEDLGEFMNNCYKHWR